SDLHRPTDQLAIDWHCSVVSPGLRQWYRDYRTSLQCNHFTSFTAGQRAHRTCSKVCSPHPVKSIWTAAPLEVTQNDTARFLSGKFFDPPTQLVANAS